MSGAGPLDSIVCLAEEVAHAWLLHRSCRGQTFCLIDMRALVGHDMAAEDPVGKSLYHARHAVHGAERYETEYLA